MLTGAAGRDVTRLEDDLEGQGGGGGGGEKECQVVFLLGGVERSQWFLRLPTACLQGVE